MKKYTFFMFSFFWLPFRIPSPIFYVARTHFYFFCFTILLTANHHSISLYWYCYIIAYLLNSLETIFPHNAIEKRTHSHSLEMHTKKKWLVLIGRGWKHPLHLPTVLLFLPSKAQNETMFLSFPTLTEIEKSNTHWLTKYSLRHDKHKTTTHS